MKISNRLFNDQQIKQFSKQMENIQNVQNRISSGKNIIFASDDPVGAVELSGLNDVTTRIDQFLKIDDIPHMDLWGNLAGMIKIYRMLLSVEPSDVVLTSET